jgi:hypothetical protein
MSRRRSDRLPPELEALDRPGPHATALVLLHGLATERCQLRLRSGADWDEILECGDDELGGVLDHACHAAEQACPLHLAGFFADCRFAAQVPCYLRRAMGRTVSLITASEAADKPRFELLADLHQQSRALSTKQWQGAFFTPWHLAKLMAEMSEIGPADWILDPACGGAVMLAAALERVQVEHGTILAESVTLLGVELDERTCQIARASLLLAGADPLQFFIAHGDALAQPLVGRDRDTGRLRQLEPTCQLANPPFGTRTTSAALERSASDGPLIVPDEILYRLIPTVAGTLQSPATAQIKVRSEPTRTPAPRRTTAQEDLLPGDGRDAELPLTFYLGAPHANWLNRMRVPLFMSYNTLRRRGASLSPQVAFAIDSGGYTELQRHERWTTSPQEYAEDLMKLNARPGSQHLEFVAQQDWMCDPKTLTATGLSVVEHQERTVANLLELRDLLASEGLGRRIVPVLQGATVDDYLTHADLFAAAGIDLRAEGLVGVGSLCARQDHDDAYNTIISLRAYGLRRLHGFGVSSRGLARLAPLLASCDSMAWSLAARHCPRTISRDCTHRRCTTCPRFALAWRTQLLDGVREQLSERPLCPVAA